MKEFTTVLNSIKTNKFNWEQQFQILEIIFEQVENKENMINVILLFTRNYIRAKDILLNKYVCAVEGGHPNSDPYSFIQYVKQHTCNGTTLDSCPAFTKYFNKEWLPFAKKEMFNSLNWQKEQGHLDFFNNLKKTLEIIKK